MGGFANGPVLKMLAWLVAIIIVGLNAWLLWLTAISA
jgi:Mn2+/Fe2+ NRAMP family transporter